MNTNMIIDTLNNKQNGQFFKISYVSDVNLTASAKKNGVRVYKETVMTARKGINYKSQKAVKARYAQLKAEGKFTDDEVTGALPWGSWKAGYEGLVLEHKGQNYIRLYTSPNKATTRYFMNGQEISVNDLKATGYVLPSYWNKSSEKPLAMSIKAENIQQIW